MISPRARIQNNLSPHIPFMFNTNNLFHWNCIFAIFSFFSPLERETKETLCNFTTPRPKAIYDRDKHLIIPSIEVGWLQSRYDLRTV